LGGGYFFSQKTNRKFFVLPLGGVTKTFAKKMEKNFEKLSIEEMSLVSGGDRL